MTVPGVPDIYQGAEQWNFSMVDPDNRRPVDFAERQRAFCTETSFSKLVKNWDDGRLKQSVTHKLLRLRAEHPELFLRGSYHALDTNDERVCAYYRAYDDKIVAVAVQLYPSLDLKNGKQSKGVLEFPETGSWRNIIDVTTHEGNLISCKCLFDLLPVAVLLHTGEMKAS